MPALVGHEHGALLLHGGAVVLEPEVTIPLPLLGRENTLSPAFEPREDLEQLLQVRVVGARDESFRLIEFAPALRRVNPQPSSLG